MRDVLCLEGTSCADSARKWPRIIEPKAPAKMAAMRLPAREIVKRLDIGICYHFVEGMRRQNEDDPRVDMLDWLNLYVLAMGALASTIIVLSFMYGRLPWVKGTIRRTYQKIYTHLRTRDAERIIERRLLEGSFYIETDYYQSCFRMNPRDAGRQIRDEVIPNGPEWLNDFFIVSALEALSRKEQVVKAAIFIRGNWPPQAGLYRFQVKKPGESVEARRKEIETNGICYQYQRWMQQCPLTYRFEEEGTQPLESAPPCERCWE